MANRTFKLYGAGYDSAGSINLVLTVGGSEVHNGAVTVGTTNVFGSDLTESELCTFELDETVTGDVAWQMSATGTSDDSKVWISKLECNLVRPNMTIEREWFQTINADLIANNGGDLTGLKNTTAEQQKMATDIGQARLDAASAGLYDRLMAGNAVISGGDGYHVTMANEEPGKSTTDYELCDHVWSNGVKDGEAYAIPSAGWPRLGSGETINATLTLGIPTWAYINPMVIHPDDE